MKVVMLDGLNLAGTIIQPFRLVPCSCATDRYKLLAIWSEYAESVDEAIAKAQSPAKPKSKYQTTSSWHMLPFENGIYHAAADRITGENSEIHITPLKKGGVLFSVKNHICKTTKLDEHKTI